ncbi:DUF2806 domain-containing protein [Mesorhizobium loti]|uniref:DUF2806 domain-containing protein n=1 Tax=Rhizobium loti TaxID=381 RepID=UPI00047DC5E0|nr:DUF2806 domain-containing protein [Mesorhizobium loti]
MKPDTSALDRAIESYRRNKQATVPYDAIALKTTELPNPFVAVTTRNFFNIRYGTRTSYEKLASIAKVLGVEVDELVDHGAATVPALGKKRDLLDLSDEVVQVLVETLLDGMISNIKPSHSVEEIYASITRKVLSGQLTAEVDSDEAKEFFSQSRNPERDARFERNIRKVVEKSLPYLRKLDDVEAPPDQTWVDTFSAYAQKVSDDELQGLWAQIFAGKLERPGAFSLKTLRVVQDLSRRQAMLFTRLCGLVFLVTDAPRDASEASLLSIRLDRGTDEYLRMGGLKFDDLVELSDFGLVNLGSRSYEVETGAWFTYFDNAFQVTDEVAFKANPLSSVGRELFGLATPTKSEAYLKAVLKMIGQKAGPLQQNPT